MSQSPESDEKKLQQRATDFFSDWSSSKILRIFKRGYDQLTRLSIDFLKICFKSIKAEELSIYLSNVKMQETLAGYDDWAPFIPTDTVGLHKKFKTNAGLLSHMYLSIEEYRSDDKLMDDLNDLIYDTTEYTDLDHMLDYGMYRFSLAAQFFFCIQSFAKLNVPVCVIFCCCAILFLYTFVYDVEFVRLCHYLLLRNFVLFYKQVKTQNIYPQNQHNDQKKQ